MFLLRRRAIPGTESPLTGPAYRIETSRLVVRCYEPADAPLLDKAVIESLDHLRPSMPWIADEPLSLAARVQRLRRMRADFDSDRDYIYGIFDRREHSVVGGTGLHTRAGDDAREIGYWIHARQTGRGYASESTAALVRVGFELDGLRRIEIHCDPRNHRSAAIPRKLGFTHTTTLRGLATTPDGAPRDTMIWTLAVDDYPASPSAHADIAAFGASGERLL